MPDWNGTWIRTYGGSTAPEHPRLWTPKPHPLNGTSGVLQASVYCSLDKWDEAGVNTNRVMLACDSSDDAQHSWMMRLTPDGDFSVRLYNGTSFADQTFTTGGVISDLGVEEGEFYGFRFRYNPATAGASVWFDDGAGFVTLNPFPWATGLATGPLHNSTAPVTVGSTGRGTWLAPGRYRSVHIQENDVVYVDADWTNEEYVSPVYGTVFT